MMNQRIKTDQYICEFWKNPGQKTDLNELFDRIVPLFEDHGEMIHQSPIMLVAKLQSSDCAQSVVYGWPSERPEIILAFRRTSNGIWQSLFPGAPVLAFAEAVNPQLLGKMLEQIRVELGAEILYFPRAYSDMASAKLLASVPGISLWDRNPSPMIAWDDRGAGLLERFRERHGSQAGRKMSRWKRHLQAVRYQPQEAADVLVQIDAASWKAAIGANLEAYGQLDYYANLLKTGVIELTAAVCDNKPIAYRLDSFYRDTVYCLEWSFDERYSNLSPGMFLLVEGLVERWGTESLSQIDLFGSPDLLKTLVETHRRPCMDFAWGSESEIQRLRDERLKHDELLSDSLSASRGLKKIFGWTSNQEK